MFLRNNWVEPLKNWIKSAHHAEKLALSNDFYEIKLLTEKIGTNRQMLDKNVLFGLRPPFDLIQKYKEKCERSPAPAGRGERANKLLTKSVKFRMVGALGVESRSQDPQPCIITVILRPADYFLLPIALIHLAQALTLLPLGNRTHCKFGCFLFFDGWIVLSPELL